MMKCDSIFALWVGNVPLLVGVFTSSPIPHVRSCPHAPARDPIRYHTVVSHLTALESRYGQERAYDLVLPCPPPFTSYLIAADIWIRFIHDINARTLTPRYHPT